MEQFEDQFPQTDEAQISNAKKDMRAGLLWCVIGLLVTYLSYYFTKSGSRFIVATGAILYGAVQGIKGLVVYLKMMKRYQETDRFKKALILGIISIAAVVGLAIGGFKLSHKGLVTLLSESQAVVDQNLGVRFTIPSGFGQVKVDYYSYEDDSTIYTAEYTAMGRDAGIGVNLTANAKLVLAVDYILSDSLNYNLADTAAMNIAINSVESYDSYFKECDKEMFDTPLYEPYYIDLGGKTYYKSSGEVEDGVNTIYYRTFHQATLVEIRYLYSSGDEASNNEKENWANGFVKNSFQYFNVQ